jgi:hypothetical protein
MIPVKADFMPEVTKNLPGLFISMGNTFYEQKLMP